MPIVLKYGGNAMTDAPTRVAVAEVIAAAHAAGRDPVVVHGGGPMIQAALDAAGIASAFVRGLRVTPPEAMPHVESALTLVGKQLASEIGAAVSLTGRDAHLLRATVAEAALGRVGRMQRVDTSAIDALFAAALVPVIGCIALDADGAPLNVNADEVAGAVAGALGAPVVFLTNVVGILDRADDPASLLTSLARRDVAARIADGRIGGGMIPKVEAALSALELGARHAIIADGRTPEAVAQALSGSGGTRIVED